ncbi:MAG: hypothetical protein OXB86_03890 [Bdellovibrionales bacterium]|nr:hypothetical protein [Bdellovibrionales bacterium]
MNIKWEGLFSGLLQGITEFLPISSSGHLFLLERWLQFSENPLSFFLVLHGATALSIILVFSKDLTKLSLSLQKKETFLLILKILIALFPLIVVGLFFQTTLEKEGFQDWIVGLGFLLTGLLLFVPPSLFKLRLTKELKEISFPAAFIIGLIQALTVLPGFSRSGWTITAGLLLGLNPRAAVTFSFLIALPAILGSCAVVFLQQGGISGFSGEMIWAFTAAFISGTLSLLLVLKLVQQKKFYLFGFYLIPLGCYLLFFN